MILRGILTVDRGNHSLKAALFENGKISMRWTMPGEAGRNDIARILEEASPSGVAFSSVVPGWTEVFRDELNRRNIDGIVEAGAGIRLPFRLLVDEPERVGPDRLCAACGAFSMGIDEAVIVDAGSAVTVDVLSVRGFEGGAIIPGLSMMLGSLGEGTAVLPRIDLDRAVSPPPGKNTEEAIAAGVLFGFSAAVRELVKISLRSLTGSAATLLTGGDSGTLAGRLEANERVEPDLVLIGLNALFAADRDS